jgi:hypothetical protein
MVHIKGNEIIIIKEFLFKGESYHLQLSLIQLMKLSSVVHHKKQVHVKGGLKGVYFP